jgi:hypothetical protein
LDAGEAGVALRAAKSGAAAALLAIAAAGFAGRAVASGAGAALVVGATVLAGSAALRLAQRIGAADAHAGGARAIGAAALFGAAASLAAGLWQTGDAGETCLTIATAAGVVFGAAVGASAVRTLAPWVLLGAAAALASCDTDVA